MSELETSQSAAAVTHAETPGAKAAATPAAGPQGPGARSSGALPFSAPWLLAPMEGVTDPAFRGLVLALHEPHELGGAFTEFVRVVDRALPVRTLRRHLGAERSAIPVGIQLMGHDRGALAQTAENVLATGAPLVDLNFGCPAKGALRSCAGSAVLRDPAEVERVVSCVAGAVGGRIPVTAKIRAGYDDAERVEELARAVEAGGASMLTIHCRTRAEGYMPEVDWTRIERAVTSVSIPVCGNGGVAQHADLQRMRDETGCAYVMVGRAALGDPWIFAGRSVGRARAARFLIDYCQALHGAKANPAGTAARLKQLIRYWRAGNLLPDEETRTGWLRERNPHALFELLGRSCHATDVR